MTAQDNLTPTWRPYADQVIQTLLAHHGHRALVANPLSALDDGDAEPYDLDGIDQVNSVRARTAKIPVRLCPCRRAAFRWRSGWRPPSEARPECMPPVRRGRSP